MRRRRPTGSAARTSSPSIVMRPVSASISRLASRSSVVLPEPELPTMARNSQAPTSSETSSTALTRPSSKLLPTWSKTIRAATSVCGDASRCGRFKAPTIQLPRRRLALNLSFEGAKAFQKLQSRTSGVEEPKSTNKTSTAVALQDATVAFRLAEGRVYTAVEKANLNVAPGEFVAIVGPTGCGKSTLLNIAAGLLTPAGGSVKIFDSPLFGLNRQAGYLFQADALFPWKTAIDNVAIALEVEGTPRRDALERAQAFLASVGLGAFAHRYPHMLSGGQRKRVGLAQVLIRDPKILLMDEPFGPLDAQTRQIMGNLLLELWSADRKAVLFVTHDLEEAISLADRVVIMSAGPSARIIGDWRVTLPRPRDITEVKLTKAFHDLHREIWDALKGEVMKGYAQTTKEVTAAG